MPPVPPAVPLLPVPQAPPPYHQHPSPQNPPASIAHAPYPPAAPSLPGPASPAVSRPPAQGGSMSNGIVLITFTNTIYLKVNMVNVVRKENLST